MEEEVTFDLGIEQFLPSDKELDLEAWSDVAVDEEMQEMLDDIADDRRQFDTSEFERPEEVPESVVTFCASSLKEYINSKKNPNTVRKTESVISRFK